MGHGAAYAQAVGRIETQEKVKSDQEMRVLV